MSFKLVNTLNGYVQEVRPVSKPLKRESKAKAGERVQRALAAKGKG